MADDTKLTRRRTSAAGLLGLVCLVFAVAPQAASASGDRIVLLRQPGLDAAQRSALRSAAGVTYAAPMATADAEIVRVPAGHERGALARLNASADVVAAAPDVSFHLDDHGPAQPDYQSSQWALDSDTGIGIGATDAWTLSTGAGVTVADVDTGVQADHPDLLGHIRSDGWDYIDDDSTPQDTNGHGTATAGVIAATRDNGFGIAGAAPDASILPLRVFSSDDSASLDDVLDAFVRAGEMGVRVVSGSFSTDPVPTPSDANYLNGVFDRVFAEYPETLYVFAAGNESNDNDIDPEYPCSADADNVICVGAIGEDGDPDSRSNFGAESVDLYAPGEGVMTTWLGGTYRVESGTSFAAPYVAGEAALLLSAEPALTSAAVKDLILTSTRQDDQYADKTVSGGREDAFAALQQATVDTDGDGVADVLDPCPTVAYQSANGCPPPPPVTVSPAPTPQPTPVPQPSTAPPAGGGAGVGTVGGMPVPALPRLRSLTATVNRCRAGHTCTRTAKVKLVPDRQARVSLKVDYKACTGKRCRWSHVLVRTLSVGTRGVSVTVKAKRHKSLKHGSYRVTAVLSSAAGTAKPVTRSFRVR